MRKVKKPQMGEVLLTALYVARNRGDSRAEEIVEKYMDDITELIRNNPNYLREVLVEYRDAIRDIVEELETPEGKRKIEESLKAFENGLPHRAYDLEYKKSKIELTVAEGGLVMLEKLIQEVTCGDSDD